MGVGTTVEGDGTAVSDGDVPAVALVDGAGDLMDGSVDGMEGVPADGPDWPQPMASVATRINNDRTPASLTRPA